MEICSFFAIVFGKYARNYDNYARRLRCGSAKKYLAIHTRICGHFGHSATSARFFFQITYHYVADTSMEVLLGMLFLAFSGANSGY